MRKIWGYFNHYFKVIALDDWKGRTVLVCVGLAGITTCIVYFFVPSATNVQTFFGAAFASWLSGFVLFIITGLIIAIVTLARPDQEIFEARARNLLQRQTGPHVDYIISKLHDLFEPYLESNSRIVTVVDYDSERKMFMVIQDTELTFRSYLADIPVTFNSRIGYVNATPSPDARRASCLSYLKVDGELVGEMEVFQDSVLREFDMQVLPKSPCKVQHRMTYWIKEGEEPNRQLIKRFTRELSVEIHNQLPVTNLMVEQPSNTDLNRDIRPGDRVTVVKMIEVLPGHNDDEYAFDYRLRSA